MKRFENIFSLLSIALFMFSSVGRAETIFDSFDSDPTSRGWTKSETESSFTWLDDLVVDATGHEYVAGGYIKANMKRGPETDRLSVALSQSYDQTQEFWIEFDMRTAVHYQYERAMVGLLNSTSGNYTNALAAKVFRQQTSSSSSLKNARFNSYDSAGTNVYADPGFVYAKLVPVRVKLHYYVDGNGNGIGEVEIWHLNQVGTSDDDKLVSASDILFADGSGKTAVYDVLGIGNVPGAVSSYWQSIWFDNMYVSTEQSGNVYFAGLGSRPEPAFGTYSTDPIPPSPDPLTWSSTPSAVKATQISMTASTATDDSGVEYYFMNVTDPNHDSGWQAGSSYTDAKLEESKSYSYKVKARDLSENYNETGWSGELSASTYAETDTNPPSPSVLSFSQEPAQINLNIIAMSALTAVDAEGNGPVEYYFANVTDPNHDSGWQVSRAYSNDNLVAETTYSYKVQARDISGNFNETGWSEELSATTGAYVSTIFETFDNDPMINGWVNGEAGSTTFDYNSSGWLDAYVVRDDLNPALYSRRLSEVYDKTTEFWWEMDLLVIGSADDYQQSLFGVFDSFSGDNHHNVVADRFSRALTGNRNDLVSWDSAGNPLATTGIPESPGIPNNIPVRVKGHYYYDGSVGKADINVYDINPDGNTGNVIMMAGEATVIGSGQSLEFNLFGLGNRTDSGLSADDSFKVDNLYFSVIGENSNTILPSFGGAKFPGDFEPDGDVDWDDLVYMTDKWLDSCGDPSWCGGADIDRSGRVDFGDYSSMASNWLNLEPWYGYGIASYKDVSYLEEGRTHKLDLYYPANPKPGDRFPGIVIIHGGGWSGGDKTNSRLMEIVETLVPEGYVCASINYKLGGLTYPSWPTSLYDCKNAVAFLRTYADQYQIDANNIGVIGGSAGGHLAAMVAMVGADVGLEPPAPYPGVDTSVQACVDKYGITDLLTRQYTESDGTPSGILTNGSTTSLLGCLRDVCPDLWTLASPVTHVDSSDCPVLIIHGTSDTTVDYEQSIEFDQVLTAAGVDSTLYLLANQQHSLYLNNSTLDMRPIVISFYDRLLKSGD